MWKHLRKYYDFEKSQYVFPREVYLANKTLIRKDMDTNQFQRRFDSETMSYIIYKTEKTA